MVYAQLAGPEEGTRQWDTGTLTPSDYSNPSAYPDVFSNPNFQINQVPSQYVSQIPPDQLQGKTSQLKKNKSRFFLILS